MNRWAAQALHGRRQFVAFELWRSVAMNERNLPRGLHPPTFPCTWRHPEPPPPAFPMGARAGGLPVLSPHRSLSPFPGTERARALAGPSRPSAPPPGTDSGDFFRPRRPRRRPPPPSLGPGQSRGAASPWSRHGGDGGGVERWTHGRPLHRTARGRIPQHARPRPPRGMDASPPSRRREPPGRPPRPSRPAAFPPSPGGRAGPAGQAGGAPWGGVGREAGCWTAFVRVGTERGWVTPQATSPCPPSLTPGTVPSAPFGRGTGVSDPWATPYGVRLPRPWVPSLTASSGAVGDGALARPRRAEIRSRGRGGRTLDTPGPPALRGGGPGGAEGSLRALTLPPG
jgi:hypothetical protein